MTEPRKFNALYENTLLALQAIEQPCFMPILSESGMALIFMSNSQIFKDIYSQAFEQQVGAVYKVYGHALESIMGNMLTSIPAESHDEFKLFVNFIMDNIVSGINLRAKAISDEQQAENANDTSEPLPEAADV